MDTVNRVVPELIKNGRVPTPGIGIVAANEAVATRLGIEGVVRRGARSLGRLLRKRGCAASTRPANSATLTEPHQRDTPNKWAFAAISRILRSRCAVAFRPDTALAPG